MLEALSRVPSREFRQSMRCLDASRFEFRGTARVAAT